MKGWVSYHKMEIMTNNRCVGIRQICQFQVKQKTSFKKIRDGKKFFFCQNIVSYAKTFEKSALASFFHYVRVTLTHQPHVRLHILQPNIAISLKLYSLKSVTVMCTTNGCTTYSVWQCYVSHWNLAVNICSVRECKMFGKSQLH